MSPNRLRSLFRAFLAAVAGLALAGPALAHDGWVEPYAPVVPIGEKAYLDLPFGNHSNGHASYRVGGKWDAGSIRVYALAPDGERADITARTFDAGEGDAVPPKGVKGHLVTSFVPASAGSPGRAQRGGGRRASAGQPLAGLQILVNGKRLAAAWEVRQGRVYVPADAVAAALGMRAVFNPGKPEHGVTLQRRGHFVHLHADEMDAHVDGKAVRLDSPAAYVARDARGAVRAMVPLRFVVQVFGGKVVFRPAAAGRPPKVTATLSP